MKIQLKRSSVLKSVDGVIVEPAESKAPLPDQMEYGELAVNYNVNDPAIYIKGSDDVIIRMAGANSVGTADTLQEVTTQGNTTTNSIELNRAEDNALIIKNTSSEANEVINVTYNSADKFKVLASGAVDAKASITSAENFISSSGYFRSNQVNGTDSAFEAVQSDVLKFKVLADGGVAIGGTIDESATQDDANIFLKNDGSAAFSSNATVGGTLGVTSDTTLGGTVGITGDTTIATDKVVITAATGAATFAGEVTVDTITPDTYSFASLAALPE